MFKLIIIFLLPLHSSVLALAPQFFIVFNFCANPSSTIFDQSAQPILSANWQPALFTMFNLITHRPYLLVLDTSFFRLPISKAAFIIPTESKVPIALLAKAYLIITRVATTPIKMFIFPLLSLNQALMSIFINAFTPTNANLLSVI